MFAKLIDALESRFQQRSHWMIELNPIYIYVTQYSTKILCIDSELKWQSIRDSNQSRLNRIVEPSRDFNIAAIFN